MDMLMLVAFAAYFLCIVTIGFCAYVKSKKSDFVLGSRSLGYVVTALAAHASDMSAWLFMGLPALVYTRGMLEAWTAIGLTVFMYLTWYLIAPTLRIQSEKLHSATLPSFFQARFAPGGWAIRHISAWICLFFFACYISANLVALGHLFGELFGIAYPIGTALAVTIIFYILLGGFVSIAWIDFFQGIFLFCMIIAVPVIAYLKLGSTQPIIDAAAARNISLSLLPDISFTSIWAIVVQAAGWGLGYFGQPHIVTKFMGIANPAETYKAKWVGIVWQIITLTAAISVGLMGMALFAPGSLHDPEMLFVQTTRMLLTPFWAGIVLCAILASSINVISAMVLVCASVLLEDWYKLRTKKFNLSLHTVSRLSVLAICVVAYGIALYSRNKTIYELVQYAWTGLGASFGPLLLASLHTNLRSPLAAACGMLAGAVVAGALPWSSYGTAMLAGWAIHCAILGIGMLFDRRRLS